MGGHTPQEGAVRIRFAVQPMVGCQKDGLPDEGTALEFPRCLRNGDERAVCWSFEVGHTPIVTHLICAREISR